MPRESAWRVGQRIAQSFEEDLIRLHRVGGQAAHRVPEFTVPLSDVVPSLRIAVVAHIFYPELIGQLRASLDNLPPQADVFISVPNASIRADTIAALDQSRRGCLDVRIVDNRGRDIAPKYVAFADVYALDYDLLLFLHTKKSLTAGFGDDWRDQLFRSLAGSPEIVNGIVSMFETDPRLGVVAPSHHESIGALTGWNGNFHLAQDLARRGGFSVHRWAAPDFPSGSMFWARPRALAGLTGLGLQIGDFPPEAGQVGGTIMHALERLIFVAAEQAGYEAVTVSDPTASQAEVRTVRTWSSARSTAATAARRPSLVLFAAAAALTGSRFAGRGARRLGSSAVTRIARLAATFAHRSPRDSVGPQ
jgi:lipopolysaccharide biosynthesis protein